MSYSTRIHRPSVWGRAPVLRGFGRDVDRLLNVRGFPVVHPAQSQVPAARSAAPFVPRVEVEATEEGFTLRAELPGFEADEFEVIVENDTLTLKGAKAKVVESDEGSESEESEARTYKASERASEKASEKAFERRFRLGNDIDVNAVEASYRNGLLVVELPRVVEEDTSRSIPITTA